MNQIYSIFAACVIVITLYSCSKKTNPSETPVTTFAIITDSAVTVKKVVAKSKPKTLTTVPKVIVVTDAGAKKTVDGRLYYDLQGHRYWRNNKDGKYYLYNKSMHTNEAFKAPVKKT